MAQGHLSQKVKAFNCGASLWASCHRILNGAHTLTSCTSEDSLIKGDRKQTRPAEGEGEFNDRVWASCEDQNSEKTGGSQAQEWLEAGARGQQGFVLCLHGFALCHLWLHSLLFPSPFSLSLFTRSDHSHSCPSWSSSYSENHRRS